jgi:hypothetical protein
MREARFGWIARSLSVLAVPVVALGMMLASRLPASATAKYGALEVSGNLETQNLVRHQDPTQYQFIQNRNTVRLRVDWDWLQNGKLIDKYQIPFIERSKIFLLYRGVYDGFYDLAPTDRQVGQSRFDDLVGGPISGHDIGRVDAQGHALSGQYSRYTDNQRTGLKWENVLREAYVDFKLAKLPVSFRLGRQQVIWGESDQFRLMDIWNPLDVSWHLQQESWDNIRIPLWLGKGLWDMGDVGPISNSFLEVVYNPFDFQPNQKLKFLPSPWAAFLPDPLRNGQVQHAVGDTYYATRFNLHGTNYFGGDFKRNPQDASEVGLRFHGVTPQGLEFTTNYLYARARAVGAANPLGVQITSVRQGSGRGGTVLNADGTNSTFVFADGTVVKKLFYADVDATVKYPYNHIFGLTANYFEGDYTASVFRLETAYAMGEPYQTVEPDKLAPGAPLGFDKRNVWAGMIGFDRPTWIRLLNPKATWFLTGQVFWNYTDGPVAALRGNSGAGETPYCGAPGAETICGNKGAKGQYVGQWNSGPFAGTTERAQQAGIDPSGDRVRHWEHLITFAGTSFYRGGTVVPFIADAWDPVNDSDEVVWNVDYFYTNDLILTLQQKFFFTYGSKQLSDDAWGVGGRNVRRDETGVKVTWQF